MLNKKRSRVGAISAFVISALLVVISIWLFSNRQLVLDYLTVWTHTPTDEIAQVTERVGFTDKGRFIFYATKPSLEDQSSFNKECPRQETKSPILGCYINDRIYLYDITSEQLKGMEEVTAAHEMLHALWYRTSDTEREALSRSLQEAYDSRANDELRSRMEYYQRTEPGEFINELHAILGTEVASLGEPLESYYARFFNRQTVLALHAQYSGVYTALYDQVNDLYGKLEVLSSSIEAQSAAYDASARQLASDIEAFNSRASRGAFASQGQFNVERDALIRRSAALEAERESINAMIVAYNTHQAEYVEVAKQIEVLNDSLDSYKQIDAGPSV